MANSKNSSRLSLASINGVDVNQLKETIRAIQSQPKLGKFEFHVSNQWIDGGHNKITIDAFQGAGEQHVRLHPFVLHADEPPVLLGRDFGASPIEYLLTALSACMTTTLAYQAAGLGIEIQGIESTFEGDIDLQGFLDLDPNVRKGLREIRVNFRVKTNADKEKLEELAKKSPVFDVVTNPTPVVVHIETSQAKSKPAA